MRVFVCEFVTGGGFNDTALPAGLCREGDMMLQALVKDLAAIPGVAVSFPRDRRLPRPDLPGDVLWIDASDDPWSAWRDAIAGCDALWPIAPETDGLLERLSRLAVIAVASKPLLLGCRPDAVRLAASKRRTAGHLARHGIPTVPTVPLADALAGALPGSTTGWVVKPDDGAGAESMLLFRDAGALAGWGQAAADPRTLVVQPYLPGRATSLSLLCSGGRAMVLSCNLQDVAVEDGRFRYHGGVVGGAEDRRADYLPIAAAVARAVTGLWGYVGIDLVETADGPVVLEINPRLTTSYAGLGAALGGNPAGLVIALLSQDIDDIAVPPRPGRHPVRVDADAA